ncbi:ATP-binding protein [Paenibacillus sp. J5C_2022]|nr:ATP-binding protein [Paenibacillus sp. J5C2022]
MFGSIVLSFVVTVFASSIWEYFLEGIPLIGRVFPFIIFLGSFFLLFFLFMHPVITRLQVINEGLMTIANGNLSCRVQLSCKDELGEIASNINDMAERLQTMIHKERMVEAAKMELITNVSHDLRTPLTSIIGYLNLLLDDDYQNLTEHKRYIRNAFYKTQQLKKLIDDLFEYTRLTSGTVQLGFQAVDLRSLFNQIINEFEPLAQQNGITVSVEMEQGEATGWIDAEMFVRAVDNLLMNALKFSVRPSEITIKLYRKKENIGFVIENLAEPIAEHQLERLFERFYKVDASRSEQNMPQGAGLGLSIARSIIMHHGGSLNLAYDQGRFAFRIDIPAHHPIDTSNDADDKE